MIVGFVERTLGWKKKHPFRSHETKKARTVIVRGTQHDTKQRNARNVCGRFQVEWGKCASGMRKMHRTTIDATNNECIARWGIRSRNINASRVFRNSFTPFPSLYLAQSIAFGWWLFHLERNCSWMGFMRMAQYYRICMFGATRTLVHTQLFHLENIIISMSWKSLLCDLFFSLYAPDFLRLFFLQCHIVHSLCSASLITLVSSFC